MPQRKTASKKSARAPRRKTVQKQKVRAPPRPQRNAPTLSTCARDYASALVDPENAPLACVPSEYPPIPSQKVKVFCRGVASTGTQGIGFVSFHPQAGVSNNTTAVLSTDSLYALTVFPAAVSGTVTGSTLNAPWPTASFTAAANGLRYRIVGASLKVQYNGSEMDLQGTMTPLRHPDNAALSGYTNAELNSNVGAVRHSIDSRRLPIHVHWVPTDPTDTEYNGVVPGVAPPMGVMFTGPTSRSNWVTWEAWMIYEVVGQAATSRSLSHADPEGFSSVLTAAQSIGDTAAGSLRAMASNLVNAATAELSRMSGHVVRGLGTLAVGYVANRYAGMAQPRLGAAPAPRVTIEEVPDEDDAQPHHHARSRRPTEQVDSADHTLPGARIPPRELPEKPRQPPSGPPAAGHETVHAGGGGLDWNVPKGSWIWRDDDTSHIPE